jgi:hypothetical protein
MDTTWFATCTKGFMHDGANITKLNNKEVTLKRSMAFLDQRRGKMNGNTMKSSMCRISKGIKVINQMTSNPRLRTH